MTETKIVSCVFVCHRVVFLYLLFLLGYLDYFSSRYLNTIRKEKQTLGWRFN